MLSISEFLRAPDSDRRMLVIRHLNEAGAMSASGFASLLGAQHERDHKTVGRTFGYLRDHKLIDWARDDRGKVVANGCKVTDQGLALLSKSQINVSGFRQMPAAAPRTQSPIAKAASKPVATQAPAAATAIVPAQAPTPPSAATAVPTPVERSRRYTPRLIQPDGKVRRATLIEIFSAKRRGISFGSEPMTMAEFNGEARPPAAVVETPAPRTVSPAPAPSARREAPKRHRPVRVVPHTSPRQRPADATVDIDTLFGKYLRAAHTAEEFSAAAGIPLAEARDLLERGVLDGTLAAPDIRARYLLKSRLATEQVMEPQAELITREELVRRGIDLSAEDRLAAVPHRQPSAPKPVRQPLDATAVFGKPDVGMIASMPHTDGDFLFALSTTLSKLRITSGGLLTFGDKKHLQSAIERFLGLCYLDLIPDAGCSAQSHAIAAGIEPAASKRILDLGAMLGFIEAGKDDIYAVRTSLKGKPAAEIIRFAIARIDSLRTVGASRRKLGHGNWRSSGASHAMSRT